MQEFSLQGQLSTTGTRFFSVPEKNISKVTSIRFNNPAAYNLTLAKYDTRTKTLVNIYNLSLSAGDTVTDSYVYFLEANEYLVATSSVPGTTFILNGVTYQISA